MVATLSFSRLSEQLGSLAAPCVYGGASSAKLIELTLEIDATPFSLINNRIAHVTHRQHRPTPGRVGPEPHGH